MLALVHVVAAFFPEVGYDALAMHLFISGYLEANTSGVSTSPAMYGP